MGEHPNSQLFSVGFRGGCRVLGRVGLYGLGCRVSGLGFRALLLGDTNRPNKASYRRSLRKGWTNRPAVEGKRYSVARLTSTSAQFW